MLNEGNRLGPTEVWGSKFELQTLSWFWSPGFLGISLDLNFVIKKFVGFNEEQNIYQTIIKWLSTLNIIHSVYLFSGV